MFVYQRHVVPITRLMALGFARGVVMEIVKGNKMNQVMYEKWMNQEQQRKQKGFVDFKSGDDNAFTKIKIEGRE